MDTFQNEGKGSIHGLKPKTNFHLLLTKNNSTSEVSGLLKLENI